MKVPIIKLGIWVSTSLVVSSSLITWSHGKVSPVISSYLTVMGAIYLQNSTSHFLFNMTCSYWLSSYSHEEHFYWGHRLRQLRFIFPVMSVQLNIFKYVLFVVCWIHFSFRTVLLVTNSKRYSSEILVCTALIASHSCCKFVNNTSVSHV